MMLEKHFDNFKNKNFNKTVTSNNDNNFNKYFKVKSVWIIERFQDIQTFRRNICNVLERKQFPPGGLFGRLPGVSV